MGRPSSFSDTEDEIVLRYSGHPAEVVNAALLKVGGTTRTPQQLAQRRYYLTSRRAASRRAGRQSRIGRIEAERQAVISEMEMIEKRHQTLIDRLRELNADLSAEVSSIDEDAHRRARTDQETS